ncbi:hybrid sensor histidine kinase/response regulator [Limnoglobus roseus]|uniref:histidine kinase n=1 Tax=Limnoglobus roseus TaxID=2598579 RepID=A0A5C1ATP8_9BACT|nr:PAS domain S-box protein [Limnoglobus roseus]QEL20594.1 PAS domain S-box protein [Limnoglobus roseus]
MTALSIRVLHLEDDPADAQLVAHELARAGFTATGTVVVDEAGFTAALADRPDVILCDWNLPGFDAERAMQIVARECPEVPTLVVSGSIGEEAAAQAIRAGAADYVLKDRLGRLGQAVKYALAHRDLIAAERRAREELAASEKRYRALAEGIPQLVWTADAAGGITYVNRQALEFSGRTPYELMGDGWARAVHPDDADCVLGLWGDVVRSGEPRDFEVRLCRADGVYRWHVSRQVAVRDASGGVVQWIGTCTDIHDRRTAGERSARDAQILAGVRDAVVVTDLNGIITYWNAGAEELFGWAAAEVISQPYDELLPPAAREAARRFAAEQAAGGEWQGEYECPRKDGTRVWIDARVRRFDRPDGSPAGILGVSHDVTPRRRLEEQFRQAQKMEAVGRLAGGVAHDFNNLLTVINGYAELMLPGTPVNHPHRVGLAAVRDAGERAAALTSQLLAFSRKAIVAPRVLDLNEVVAQTESLLRRLIGEDVKLAAVLDPAGCRIMADPSQLDQVIMNLAVNARDAMPTGGRLTIQTRRVHLAAALGDLRPGQFAELVVSDTGCGMTAEVQAQLFEPFFTTKEPGRGTGLGLAVVHGVVTQASGHVTVESTVGTGTTFRILFPEAATPAAAAAADAVPSDRRGTETVLLVEDEDSVRTLCKIALESQGYRVLAAACGREAMQALDRRDGSIDLLLTDVVMPELCGREFAEAAQTAAPGVKVLYMSGYTDDAVIRHGVREAPTAFLQKPFTPLGLSRKVRAVLDGTG